MGRAAPYVGSKDRRSSEVDRLANGDVFRKAEPRPTSSVACNADRVGPLLPCASIVREAEETTRANALSEQVAPPQLWSQLPVTEQQRFGQCFSRLLLQTLGFRACPAQEVEG
jgi:hypothetical protein